MKKTLTTITSIVLCLSFLLTLCACGQKIDAEGLWQNATYRSDKEFGKGAKTATIEIVTEEKTVTITLKTDEEILGTALIAEKLIGGEEGAYGLYVKEVNGVVADYNVDQTYWAFYIDGEFALTGVDTTPIEEGKIYKLSKEKG